MKKVEFFSRTSNVGMWTVESPDFVSLKDDINAFLAKDGDEIKVLDVQYRSEASGTVSTAVVMVYYEEL